MEVVALPFEALVRLDVDDQEKVTAAAVRFNAFAGHPYPRARGHAGRDAHLDPARLHSVLAVGQDHSGRAVEGLFEADLDRVLDVEVAGAGTPAAAAE